MGVPEDVHTWALLSGDVDKAQNLLSNHKDLYLNREHGATAEIAFGTRC